MVSKSDSKITLVNYTPKKWNAKETLPQVDDLKIRYNSGFLKTNFTDFFSPFYTEWKKLLEFFHIHCELISITPVLKYPKENLTAASISINKQPCYMAFDQEIEQAILGAFIKNQLHQNVSSITEYVQKKLLYSLKNSFKGNVLFKLGYDSPISIDDIKDVFGVVELCFKINNKNASIWFMLNQEMTDRIDTFYKNKSGRERDDETDGLNIELTIILASLTVQTSCLSDYTKTGAVIELGQPQDTKVAIEKYNQIIATGELYNFNDHFAIKITDITKPQIKIEDVFSDTTTVNIDFDLVEMKQKEFKTQMQPDSYLTTIKNISDMGVTISVAENTIAVGEVCLVNDKLAVRITEKIEGGF